MCFFSSTGHSTKNRDVYSMGILLLQLITKRVKMPWRITESVLSKFEGENLSIVHTDLKDSGCTEEDDRRITTLALRCLDEDITRRPTIQEVVDELGQLNGNWKLFYLHILDAFIAHFTICDCKTSRFETFIGSINSVCIDNWYDIDSMERWRFQFKGFVFLFFNLFVQKRGKWKLVIGHKFNWSFPIAQSKIIHTTLKFGLVVTHPLF